MHVLYSRVHSLEDTANRQTHPERSLLILTRPEQSKLPGPIVLLSFYEPIQPSPNLRLRRLAADQC